MSPGQTQAIHVIGGGLAVFAIYYVGLIAGEVQRLDPKDANTRVPHVGWNEVNSARPDPLLRLIPDGTDFYFVHSYYVEPADASVIAAETNYPTPFCSMIL